METPVPDYRELMDALDTAGVPMSAAEAHGILTGVCCSPKDTPLAGLYFEHGVVPGADGEHLLAVLSALQADTQRRLAGQELDFEPLLPADSSPVDAIGDWARGFVLGLTAGGVSNAAELPDEAGEFVRDALQIGEIQTDGSNDEAQDREIAEIVEYLRVGVQVVYEDLRPSADEPA